MIIVAMTTWQSQGQHRFCGEGDLVVFELHGVFTLDDAQCMLRIADEQNHRYGYVLWLFDARDGLNMIQEARRVVTDKLRVYPENRVTAIVGANVAIRTLSRLLQNAGRLFGVPIRPIQFFDTMDEARTWLDMQRQQCRSRINRNTIHRD